MTRNINRLWCKTRVISRWRSEPDCDKDLEDGSGGKKGMGREVGPDGVTRRDVNAGKLAASERWAGVGHTQAMMESGIRRYLTHMPPFVRSRAYHQGGVHIRLKEVASRLQRDVLDVEVEVAFQRRRYAGIRRTVRRRLRLVAVRLPESTEYRFYLTNIEPDSLDAHAVAQTYAARWQIELIFKELKSHYRLDELPTSKAHIVETLLLGAVITLLVSRRLLQAVRERLRRTPYKMPEQRWAAVFAAAAPAILDILLLPPRVSKVIARRLESMLLHEAPDPNRTRRLLIERVEDGAAWA